MLKKCSLLFSCFLMLLILNSAAFFMDGILDLNAPFEYEAQVLPDFVNTGVVTQGKPLNNEKVTLGRVLFYDTKLSLNETVSCASCHKQEFAFGDTATVSKGFDGQFTTRHSMRLINLNYRQLDSIFWESNATLEDQPSITISNPIEMGFSGTEGQPNLDSLIRRLNQVDYYKTLFNYAYGSDDIGVNKINEAISQFVRSIVSFDSKFDEGRALVPGPFQDFPNFTEQENLGRTLFISPFPPLNPPGTTEPPIAPFFGCFNCHGTESFSQSFVFRGNNGVIGVAGDSTAIDIDVNSSPSLRNLFRPDGSENGPFMHDGSLKDMRAVLKHYTDIPHNPDNPNRAIGLGGPVPIDHRVGMTTEQEDALIAFMKTLTGPDVYTNPKWSDPFDIDGNITVIPVCAGNPVMAEVDETICEGESINGYMLPGTYSDVFTAANGCDSTRVLNLSVLESAEEYIQIQACEGDVVNVDTNEYTESGTYQIILNAQNGCDSIITLELDFVPTYFEDYAATICEGEVIVIEGEEFSVTGAYVIQNFTDLGCDSIINVFLDVLPLSDPACSMVSTSETKIDFKVYPNPFENSIIIETDDAFDFHYELYSIEGKLHRTGVITEKSTTVLTDDLVSGVFFLVLKRRNGLVVDRFKVVRR